MPKVLGEPTPRFNLQFKKKEESPIAMVFRYRYQGQKHFLKYSPGLSIKTKFWDFEQQFPKKNPATSRLIGKLSQLEEETLAIYRETDGSIKPAKFREELNYRFLNHPRPEEDKYQPTFLEFIEDYTKKQQARKDLTRGTWKVLQTWKNHLQSFAKETGQELSFDSINANFRQDFLTWCYEEKEHSQNYVSKGLDIIAQFITAAREASLTENTYTNSKAWKLKKLPTPTIALSEAELEQIFKLDLSNLPPGYQKARQLFLLGAYTGLRHSDYKRISKGHTITENGKKKIAIYAKKTRKEVNIPLHPNLEAILEECNYQAPKLSSQKFNKYIKEVAQKAEITEQRAIIDGTKGEAEEIFKPKHELISSHTARRTFATVALINGWPSRLVMAITGHSTEAQLNKYIDMETLLANTQIEERYKKQELKKGKLKVV
jgi:integrase